MKVSCVNGILLHRMGWGDAVSTLILITRYQLATSMWTATFLLALRIPRTLSSSMMFKLWSHSLKPYWLCQRSAGMEALMSWVQRDKVTKWAALIGKTIATQTKYAKFSNSFVGCCLDRHSCAFSVALTSTSPRADPAD